ncbi:hypothetical protein NT017_05050 [Prolixibacter sp. NT017]|nr:hypothetical protein NT017_05050 [Prolixibacter sp. NT017]
MKPETRPSNIRIQFGMIPAAITYKSGFEAPKYAVELFCLQKYSFNFAQIICKTDTNSSYCNKI